MRDVKLIKNRSGFTLTELLVVVSIIMILALYAYPTHLAKVKRAYLTKIKVDMQSVALSLEKWNALQGSYEGFDIELAGLNIQRYQLRISDLGVSEYSIQAVALDVQKGSKCRASTGLQESGDLLSLNAAGQRSPLACW